MADVVDKDKLVEFLLSNYRPSRLRDRNTGYWSGYVDLVTESKHRDLVDYGRSYISHHDSLCGQTMRFDSLLNVIVENIEHPKQDTRLSHLF